MGATHSSSPIRSNYDYLGHRDPYSSNFGAVRFRPNSQHSQTATSRLYSKSNRSSVESNNNVVKFNDRPTSYTTTTTSKKHKSILSSSWNFAKRTASSAVPSFLNSNANNRSSSSSLSSSNSTKRQSKQISTSSSHESNISFNQYPQNHIQPTRVQEKNHRKLDELNCNSLNGWDLGDRAPTNLNYNIKPITYTTRNKSQDSLNLFNCKHNYYDEQDLTNNNTNISPRQMPNFIHSLDQFANRGHNLRNNKLEKNHSSLSTNSSEFSSNTASTESTSSFSAYNVANLSAQAKQLYLNNDVYSDEEEEVEDEHEKIDPHMNSMLRTSYSTQSFLSPSESFDNGVNGNVFGRNVIISSSTADLLRGLGRFVSQNTKVPNFEPANLVMWLRSVDRALMIQGWQDIAFLTAANLVFVYLLIREQLTREYDKIRTINELQSLVCCCLYVSYSYLGNEISYPLKPFITQHENRAKFWSRCLQLINLYSEDMLKVNHSTDFFLELFNELQTFAELERT